MEVSVIIPVYNKKDYLTDCLRSVLSQDFDDFEVIAVNDGSRDGSGQLLQQLAREHDRLRVYHTENKGVTSARRYGVERSTGRYIMFVDADDRLLPGAISHLYAQIERTGADEVIAPHVDQYGRLNDSGRRGWQEPLPMLRELLAVKFTFCVLWSVIFRRQLLEGTLEAPRIIRNGEDILMQMACLAKRPKVFFTDKPVYLYYKGLPNDRLLNLDEEMSYDHMLREVLAPVWKEVKDHYTLHQLKIYENFIENRQFSVYRQYYHTIKRQMTPRLPLQDRLVYWLPPRLAYAVVHPYKWWMRHRG